MSVSPELLEQLKANQADILFVVQGRTEEILQALGQTQFKILAAIEGDRAQLALLNETLKPQLLGIRQALAWLQSKYEKFTTL